MTAAQNLENAYSAGLQMFFNRTELSNSLVLLPAFMFFARNSCFGRRDKEINFVDPPRFDELNDLERSAIEVVYEAIVKHNQEKAQNEVPAPSVSAFLLNFSSELCDLEEKTSITTYEEWLAASVEAALATIGKIGSDDLLSL